MLNFFCRPDQAIASFLREISAGRFKGKAPFVVLVQIH